MDKTVLNNFIRNKYSKEEYLKVLKYFENDSDFEELKLLLETNWDKLNLKNIPEANFASIRAKLQEHILSQKVDEANTLKKRFMRSFSKIAAILFLPLFLSSAVLFWEWRETSGIEDAYAEIVCPMGARIQFALPDGSSGWLNSGSTLKYPVMFNGNRHIELSGEAFFKVTKNVFSPFTVSTARYDVKVLGTEFNVMAYPEDNSFQVTLQSGKVALKDLKTRQRLALSPNQRFVFDKRTQRSLLEDVETNNYTAWKEGKLIFRNTPLSEVISRLSRWYNVDMECSDQSLYDIPYRATFQNEGI